MNRGSDGSAGAADDDPLIGRVVGRYVVDRKLGEGGMGAVYRLRHQELPGSYQALKVLTLSAPGDPAAEREILDRFLQEAHAASAVGSHRVVQIFDVGQFDDGARYLVMEYVAGRSVAGAVEARGPFPVLEAMLIAARVADTLALAHGRGIIHRDIKPANLMLVSEGRDPTVKVLDFGIARATGESKVAFTTERKIIGSPGYMSPEATIGAPVDGRADVFSLSVTLFEMLTGNSPFAGANVHDVIMKTISQAAPSASSMRPPHLDPVPPEVEDLLAVGLAKSPEDRPTMVALRTRLLSLCDMLASVDDRGAIGKSVMRSLSPVGAAQRPTLSASAAEVSEILAKYGPAAQPTRPLVQIKGHPTGHGAIGNERAHEDANDQDAIPRPIRVGDPRSELTRPQRTDPSGDVAARRPPAKDTPEDEAPNHRRGVTLALVIAAIAVLAAVLATWTRPRAPSSPEVIPAHAPIAVPGKPAESVKSLEPGSRAPAESVKSLEPGSRAPAAIEAPMVNPKSPESPESPESPQLPVNVEGTGPAAATVPATQVQEPGRGRGEVKSPPRKGKRAGEPSELRGLGN